MQAALQVEFDVSRHVHAKSVRAHARTLYALLLEERCSEQFDVLRWRNHADDRCRAASTKHLVGLLSGNLQSYCFKAVVHAPAGHFEHGFDRITFTRVYRVRGAKGFRQFELGLKHVHGNDTGRAANQRAVHYGETHAAAADYRHSASGRYLSRV